MFINLRAWLIPACLVLPGCPGGAPSSSDGLNVARIVFQHGKISGDPAPLLQLISEFERTHPNIRVFDEPLPSATDQQHQIHAINLEGGAGKVDVLAMDVIWVPEFSRAGWITPLDPYFTPDMQAKFLPNVMRAVSYRGAVWAVPWNVDAGLLYYRKDLLDKYHRPPPKTWDELIETTKVILQGERNSRLYGFVWQGRQYEGLICDALEFIWGNGGDVLGSRTDPTTLSAPETVEAVAFMRDLIYEHRISPPLVTTSDEEAARHLFGNGWAIFMRNWPYAWVLSNREGSPVRGKVGMSAMPTFGSHPPASTLGGWHLGIAQSSRHPEAAWQFIEFLTSYRAQKSMAMHVGIQPTRIALYQDPELLSANPYLRELQPMLFSARPRPVTPFYPMVSQVLQSEFSAVLAGVRSPRVAMQSAERQIHHILGIGHP